MLVNEVVHGLGHGLAVRTPSSLLTALSPHPFLVAFFDHPFTRHYSLKVFGSTKQLFLGRERRDKYKNLLCPAPRWRVEIGNGYSYFIQSGGGAENFIFSWQIGGKKETKKKKKIK